MLNFSGPYFSTLFHRYCDIVDEGHYERIPYKSWRELNSICKIVKEYPETSNKAINFGTTYSLRDIIITDTINNSQWTIPDIPQDFIDFLKSQSRVLTPLTTKEAQNIISKNFTNSNNNYYVERNNTMTNSLTNSINFEFGPARDVAFSPYGMAVRANGKWLTYDPNKKQTIDVTGFNFDFGNLIYKMPIAVKDVRPGDMVLHQGKPIYVTNVSSDGISCIDIVASEAKTVIPLTNMFGFNYLTRIAPLMDFNLSEGEPSEDNPFGNFARMLVMNELFNGSTDNSSFDFSKLAMISMFTGGKMPFFNMFGATEREPANN